MRLDLRQWDLRQWVKDRRRQQQERRDCLCRGLCWGCVSQTENESALASRVTATRNRHDTLFPSEDHPTGHCVEITSIQLHATM